MLVVSRKVGERILIGDSIAITVVKVGSGGVRIGVDAPKELAVVREELAKQIEADEHASLERVRRAEFGNLANNSNRKSR